MVDEAYFSWLGQPFGVRKHVELCLYCGHAVKPLETDTGVAIVGTNGCDVHSFSDMVEDGFTDKIRVRRSIRSVGKFVGLEPKQIKAKLKER